MKAVIFDRDGVIVNSEPVNVMSAFRAFNKLGIELAEEDKAYIVGRHPIDYRYDLEKKYQFSYDKFRKMQRKLYYELFDSAELFLETIHLIKQLKKLGIPLGLTTSSGLESTNLVLKRGELEGIFDVVVTHEDYEKRKPHPEPYQETAKKLDVNTAECIVIEDSEVGLQSAKAAGMKCIILRNQYTTGQDFSSADSIFSSAKDIKIDLLLNI
ncbi:HAD-IA family hydrolase [Candidatus Dojkabacteria bacterium]|nr:HAD-IA family hydrolase [Candidatus Dojkabacteria bacterium]